MEKTIAAAVFGILALAAAEEQQLSSNPSITVTPPSREPSLGVPPGVEPGTVRNLLLPGVGRRDPKPGEIRIPIPADGAMYEVIVTKPGLARSIPARR